MIEEEAREQQRKTVQEAADEFLLDYKLKHESATFAEYALGHLKDHLAKKLVVEITPTVVKRYQTDRMAAGGGPKTINDEVLLLLRLCGDQGDLIRAKLRREKSLKLKTPPSPGRAYTADEKARMLAEAQKLRSKNIYPALVVDLNCGLRDKELRELRWQQIDLTHKKQLTVGKSKTEAGTGRVIPLNDTVMIALEAHAAWYVRWFGDCKPEWYVFPAGKGQPNDPTTPVTTLKTAWTKVRNNANVVGRWHDNRHTLITELAESRAGDEVIMSIEAMSHVPCCRATPTCGWRRNDAPSTRLPRANELRMKSAGKRTSTRGSMRLLLSRCFSSRTPVVGTFLHRASKQPEKTRKATTPCQPAHADRGEASPRVPQFPVQSLFRASKYLSLQRDAATT